MDSSSLISEKLCKMSDYFYASSDAIAGSRISISGDEFKHLTHVMRKQVGDAIVIVDGKGKAYASVIQEIATGSAICAVQDVYERIHEPRITVTLAVALLKNPSRFDVLVEKTTELGVHRIVPLITERTIPAHGKQDRWQKIALGAMKQSQRCHLPEVLEPLPFASFLDTLGSGDLRLILHEAVSEPMLKSVTGASPPPISMCIGPEGGFTEGELKLAADAGFIAVSLGDRRLRTETAAIVAIATVLS
jgi:16S rRNA (uracil1498-N3)-methyltransferase